MVRRLSAAAFITLLAATAPAMAQSLVAEQHTVWRSCLHDAFVLKASLSSPHLAADAALNECRSSERAYLDALSASPLLDADDVSGARRALVARAKLWLLGTRQL